VIYVLATTFLLSASFAANASQTELRPLTPLADLPTERYVQLATEQRYDEALLLADSLQSSNPTSPEGYFFRLTILNNRSIDFEDDLDESGLLAAADSVKAICNRRISAGDSSALVRLYLGSANGFKMIHALREHEFISAITLGSEAADILEEAIQIDSTCYDAYAGLGNYYYFQSRYGGILRAAGLIRDRRDLGIEMLRKAAAYGYLTSYAAASSIAWIWIDKEQPDSAVAIMRDLLQQHPESRAFLWCMAKAQKMLKHWDESLIYYLRLLESVRSQPRNNHHNEIGCLHSIAIAYSGLGEWENVAKTADVAFALKLRPEVAKRKSDDLDHLKQLKSEALKNLERK